MTREEKVFQMAKAIGHVFVMQGIHTQQRIIDAGGDPSNCTIEGESIPKSFAMSLKFWAETFVDELEGKV